MMTNSIVDLVDVIILALRFVRDTVAIPLHDRTGSTTIVIPVVLSSSTMITSKSSSGTSSYCCCLIINSW